MSEEKEWKVKCAFLEDKVSYLTHRCKYLEEELNEDLSFHKLGELERSILDCSHPNIKSLMDEIERLGSLRAMREMTEQYEASQNHIGEFNEKVATLTLNLEDALKWKQVAKDLKEELRLAELAAEAEAEYADELLAKIKATTEKGRAV